MYAALSALLLAASPPATDTWPGFRGDGSSRTAARGLPLTWSPTENVAWRVGTPGHGQSAPVVWKDRGRLAVEGDEKETLHVLCYTAADGRRLWQKSYPATQRGKNNPMMSRAAPTPVADADGVYAFFESGDLVALTHDGTERWRRSLSTQFGGFRNNHGLGSSPAQTDRAVLMLVDHQKPSYLPAVNKADGKDLWKADDFARRWEEARRTATGTLPKPPEGKGPGGSPPLPKEETEAARYAAVGDVVYGVAAVDGAFFVRTGTELVCVRATDPAKRP